MDFPSTVGTWVGRWWPHRTKAATTALLEREGSDEVVHVRFGDEDAVEGLLLSRGAGLAGLEIQVGLVDGLLGEARHRLEHGVLQLALLDAVDGVRRPVEPADLDLRELSGFLERS